MVMAYNIAATHRLSSVSGYDEITHLQFTAPMESKTANLPNQSGEEPGLPSGSVVSMNADGLLVAGAIGTAMPMYLLWNSTGSSMMGTFMTANGQRLGGIGANSAYQLDNNTGVKAVNSAELIRGDLIGTGENTGRATGSANSLPVTWDIDSGEPSYTLYGGVGNYTCWPATCGLEVSTTEFDLSKETEFTVNTLLTSPLPDATVAISSSDTETVQNQKYQKRRGGYLTPIDLSGTPVTSDDADMADFGGVSVHNVCGTVSRPVKVNENGIKVLRFWAERTLIPAVTTSTSGG